MKDYTKRLSMAFMVATTLLSSGCEAPEFIQEAPLIGTVFKEEEKKAEIPACNQSNGRADEKNPHCQEEAKPPERNRAPLLESITPNEGSFNGGQGIRIEGNYFQPGVSVKIGSRSCVVTAMQPSFIECLTPSNDLGIHDVLITNPDDQDVALTRGYTYRQDTPTITSVTPSTGDMSGGSSLTIAGTGFKVGATVSIGGASCGAVSVISPTQITCTAPPASVSGVVSAVVTHSDGKTGTLSNAYTYQCNLSSGSWTTVMQWQLTSGMTAHVQDILATSSAIYAVGGALGTDSEHHWIVRKSTDGGATWSTIEDIAATGGAIAREIAADSSGNLFVVGHKGTYWLVRKSTDAGNTWTTVDEFQLSSSLSSAALGIGIDSNARIYVTGEGNTPYPDKPWVTRKSSDGGNTWSTVDNYNSNPGPAGTGGSGRSVVISSSGDVYIAGIASVIGGGTGCVIRKSVNGGSSWSVIANYQYSPNYTCSVYEKSLALDTNSGALFFAMDANDSNNLHHWWVKKSSDGGTTWSTVDDYNIASQTFVRNILISPLLGVTTFGIISDAPGSYRWITRASSDAGSTWTNSDSASTSNTPYKTPYALASDPSGNIYTGGGGTGGMFVRKLGCQ